MNEDLEKLVHRTLVKCSEWFNPETDGFYEVTDKYREDVNELYKALLKFDIQYGYESNG